MDASSMINQEVSLREPDSVELAEHVERQKTPPGIATWLAEKNYRFWGADPTNSDVAVHWMRRIETAGKCLIITVKQFDWRRFDPSLAMSYRVQAVFETGFGVWCDTQFFSLGEGELRGSLTALEERLAAVFNLLDGLSD